MGERKKERNLRFQLLLLDPLTKLCKFDRLEKKGESYGQVDWAAVRVKRKRKNENEERWTGEEMVGW